MTSAAHILDRLSEDLGFAPDLLGGRETVLGQIERFLAAEKIPTTLDPATQPALWARLVADVVVPETSFFRYPESFHALRHWLLENPDCSPQILCLPCSTGEEAYSIAITLREADVANFHIRAYDASARSVAHALHGHYPPRARRGLPETVADKWLPHGDAHKDLRAPIRFLAANAFDLDLPADGFDIIFCRNLLIYFDATNQHRLFTQLDRWLKPGGILFLGPGEATTAANHGWKGTGLPMSFSFQRAPIATATPPRKIARPIPRIPPPARRPIPSPAPAPTPEPEIVANLLEDAEALANAGELPAAMESLRKFHAAQTPTAASLLLRGILEEASSDIAAAETSYRQAIYLDPGQLDALMHLSLLLESSGRASAAAPFRRRVERLTATP